MTTQDDVSQTSTAEVLVEGHLLVGEVLDETGERVQLRFTLEGVTQVRWFPHSQVLRDA
jgi:hypothetical protein